MTELTPKITELFANLPQPYEERAAAMTAIDQAFHREMAVQIQGALKDEIRRKPHATYEEKKDLSKWVNGELRRYGLAIGGKIEEKDGQGTVTEKTYPGILAVDIGRHPQFGRFKILCKPTSRKPVFPVSSQDLSVILDHFNVIADDPDRRRVGKWANQLGERTDITR